MALCLTTTRKPRLSLTVCYIADIIISFFSRTICYTNEIVSNLYWVFLRCIKLELFSLLCAYAISVADKARANFNEVNEKYKQIDNDIRYFNVYSSHAESRG